MLVKGNIVEQFQNGETKITICDDYCKGKTAEDVEKILKDLAKEIYPVLAAKQFCNTA